MLELQMLRRQIECHFEGQLVWPTRDHVHLQDGLSQAIRPSSTAEQAVGSGFLRASESGCDR
ncbi:MAG: hypothetical protein AAGF24_09975 [Cyanobacteria bacterium P01_H01_bin.121]